MTRAGTAAGAVLTDARREELGWSPAETRQILKALGYAPIKAESGEPTAWRRRQPRARPKTPAAPVPTASPFSALSALQVAPKPRRRRRPKAARA